MVQCIYSDVNKTKVIDRCLSGLDAKSRERMWPQKRIQPKTHKLIQVYSIQTLQQTCYQQADIRMHLHDLRQLVGVKSVASCQQTCCKLIVKTCYLQVCCKLFQQVVISLQMTSCKKSGFDRLIATYLMKLILSLL